MIDAVVVGRVGVDLYPNQLRTPLREIRTYTRFVGGFAGNVSTGLARLGVRPAIVSRVGDDGHGEVVRSFLAAEGVDVRFLGIDPAWLTPPTFCASNITWSDTSATRSMSFGPQAFSPSWSGVLMAARMRAWPA